MFIKNTSEKILGFDKVAVLPGETGELPDNFNAKHPVVKFYLKKGFIAIVSGADIATSNNIKQRPKSINRMKLDELRDIAIGLGVSFTSADTKASLIEKINEKQSNPTENMRQMQTNPNDSVGQGGRLWNTHQP
jgi:hypothetical protein